jgi:hypothetical protein
MFTSSDDCVRNTYFVMYTGKSWPQSFNENIRRKVSSETLRRVALVRTDVSEEPGASFISVTRIVHSVRRLLVAACVVPSSPILVTLMKEAPSSSETSVLTRSTRRNIPEDTFLHSHRRENLKSYENIRICEFTSLNQQNFLCNIWGFEGGDYEECRLLGCYAVLLL